MNKKDEAKLFAFLAAFLTIVGFVIAIVLKKEDKYVIFYAKHGLVLFIVQIIASVASSMPIFGWFFGPVLWILFFILWIITWINALSGEKRKTLIIGKYAEKLRV